MPLQAQGSGKKVLRTLATKLRIVVRISWIPMMTNPDFVRKAAEAVAKDPKNIKGIIFGGSGQGEAEEANRHKGVRAAVFYGGQIDCGTLTRAQRCKHSSVIRSAVFNRRTSNCMR